jgi:hypothetical protein
MKRKFSSAVFLRVLIAVVASVTGIALLLTAGIAATKNLAIDQDPTGILQAMRQSVLGKLANVADDASAKSDLTQIPAFHDLVQQDTSQFTIEGTSTLFTTDTTTIIPKANIAITRAMRVVGNADAVCHGGDLCEHLCDKVAGWIWGYEDYSGYYSAYSHWETAVKTGVGHPGGRDVPVGALLFWKGSGPFGHVATYIGNGLAISNMIGPKGPQLYQFPADHWEKVFGVPYLGWAMPIFHGDEPGARL